MQVFNLELKKQNNNNNSGVFGATDVAATRATSVASTAGTRRSYLGFEFFGDLNDWFLCFVGIWFILLPVQPLSRGHERALRRSRAISAKGFLQKRSVTVVASPPDENNV